MKVFLLTEGGSRRGLGHITRCIALYEQFMEKGITPLALVNSDMPFSTVLGSIHHRIFDWCRCEDELLQIIERADSVIVDSYEAPLALYKKIAQSVQCAVYIDDNQRLEYPPGVVINPNIHAEKVFHYSEKKNQRLLLGGNYLLLRKEFVELKNWRRSFPNMPQHVLIALGASKIGHTFAVSLLEALQVADIRSIEIKIVNAGQPQEDLENLKRHCQFPVDIVNGTQSMVSLMQWADVGFNGLGITSSEMAWMQLPFIFKKTNAAQTAFAAGYKRMGVRSCSTKTTLPKIFEKLFSAEFYSPYSAVFGKLRTELNCFDVTVLLS